VRARCQVLLESLVGIMHRAAAMAGIKLLPAEWIPLPPSKLRAMLVTYQTVGGEGRVPCVDWRRVLFTLADLPRPTVEQLQKLVAAAGGEGSIQGVPRKAADALPLWFESLAPPETYTDANGQTVVKGRQVDSRLGVRGQGSGVRVGRAQG